ncbi:MAG: alpha/beta fold hydrolase [Acidimicrobiia bacterium]|nr:alpha/beta fold hydrolase [Acidimicrobiia bacterium]
MTSGPIPVAIRLPDGLVLRGHEWSRDGPAVLFLHDLGDDLDVWGSVTDGLAQQGFRVISVELRGHGLSDGEPDQARLRDDLVALLGEVSGSFGPVALVAYGRITELMLYLDEDQGAPVQVMVAPLPLESEPIDWRATRSALRLVLKAALHEPVAEHVNFIYPRMKGQNLQVAAASDQEGPALLEDQPQLLEHSVMFLRRYLTGYHLAWISQPSEQIKAHRDEQKAAAQATEARPPSN